MIQDEGHSIHFCRDVPVEGLPVGAMKWRIGLQFQSFPWKSKGALACLR